jgi:hypothetical protein
MTELSKRQQKIRRNIMEQHEFLYQREQFHIDAFERDLNHAIEIYDREKDEMTQEQRDEVDAKIAENLALIKTLRGMDEEEQPQ